MSRQVESIDNPGQGDCGYYAFAIGLIEHIQRECREHGNESQFWTKWQELDPSLTDAVLAKIKSFSLANMASSPATYELDLLNQLQQSLRVICYQYQIKTLRESPFQSFLYDNFLEIVNGQSDSRFNVLAGSHEVQTLAATVVDKSQDVVIQAIFYDDIQKDGESCICAAASRLTLPGNWATENELCALAQVFNLNPKITNDANPQGYDIGEADDRPTITLQNQGNYHWVTRLQQPIELSAQATSKSQTISSEAIQANYKQLIRSLFIDKDWQTKPLRPINEDEVLARKLQEEEVKGVSAEDVEHFLSSFKPSR